ncbi:MAG: bifunctional 4-hydroxy-2-oxoglutarate aldolase/2-dehydro-3-deoxy-phosphogluconate aldolase [Burkholderiales bacterium]|nr:bifunctional 4-hydroxy-2-oxoglutarate aldolase/2-dehydro-3-deoxy-phosphogluconate aldolase [Burkholderiales bacterium]
MNYNTLPTFRCPNFQSRVVPVIVITDVSQAVPMAQALLAGGIDVMEITLRHRAGLPAIEAVARHVPDMHVGAGTVTHAAEMARVQSAGASFALSPGMSDALVQAALDCGLPFMPGVMTPSEVIRARDHGFSLVKLFPAAQAGGLAMLKALSGPLADMRFCPTGGISINNLVDYLKLGNVAMVGGSWLTPMDAVEHGRWDEVTSLARQATAAAQTL